MNCNKSAIVAILFLFIFQLLFFAFSLDSKFSLNFLTHARTQNFEVGLKLVVVESFLSDSVSERLLEAGTLLEIIDVDKDGDISVSSVHKSWPTNEWIASANFNKLKILDEFSKKEGSKNLILSSYFITVVDPQRKITYEANPDMLKKWHNSILDLKLDSDADIVVFTDFEVSAKWTEIYPEITFINMSTPDWLLPFSCNVRRFIYYENLLLETKYEYMITTDLFDAEFGRNPFDFFKSHPNIDVWVGSEKDTPIGETLYWDWMENHYRECYPHSDKMPEHFQKIPLLSAGVLGGKVSAILELFAQMRSYLPNLEGIDYDFVDGAINCDMYLVNEALYDLYVKLGKSFGYDMDFTSPYKRYFNRLENRDKPWVVFHK